MRERKYSLVWNIAATLCWLAIPSVYAQSALDADLANDNVDVAAQTSPDTSVAPDPDATQDDVSDGDTDESKASTGTGSSEVEHNEENYRRFMELRERDPRTNTMPTNTFQPGTEKLDGLPESSQKHLRNQLREVIVEEGAWQPGDENKRYDYVPSEGAQTDRQLQLQEAEAWDELVGKYQEREAQIHSNSARSQAARKSADNAAAASGESSGQPGAQNGDQQGAEGQNEGAKSQTGQANQADQEALQRSSQSREQQSQDNAATAASEARQAEARNAGVSENALEFLLQSQTGGGQSDQGQHGQGQNQQGQNQQVQNGTQANSAQAPRQGTPGEQPGNSGENDGQSMDSGQRMPAKLGEPEATTPAIQAGETEAVEAGTSQNALEFLTQGQPAQEDAQSSGQQAESSEAPSESSESTDTGEDDNSTESSTEESSEPTKEPEPVFDSMPVNAIEEMSDQGTTQNAFEVLSRGTQTPTPPPADTLSIDELMNAQGLSEGQVPDESRNEKDDKVEPD